MNQTQIDKPCPSDTELRRLAFDSDVDSLNVSEDRAMQIVAHTNGCDTCRTRLAAHDAARQRFARYLTRSRK